MNKPVAYVTRVRQFDAVSADTVLKVGTPLYTHPVKALTDDEIYRLLADSIWAVGLNTDCLDEQNWADGITVAKAILRKAQENERK